MSQMTPPARPLVGTTLFSSPSTKQHFFFFLIQKLKTSVFPAGGYKQRANPLFPAHLSNCIEDYDAFPLQTTMEVRCISPASIQWSVSLSMEAKTQGFFPRGQANKQRANYAVSDGDLHEINMKQRTPRIPPASFAGETSTKGAPPAGLFSRKARKTKNISCQRVK